MIGPCGTARRNKPAARRPDGRSADRLGDRIGAGRRQRHGTLAGRQLIVFQRVEIRGGFTRVAIVGRIAAGRIIGVAGIGGSGGLRIGLRQRERSSRRAHSHGRQNSQNAFDHHRPCITPSRHRIVNGQMTEDSGAFKTNLRIRAGFRHNIMVPGLRGRDAALLEKHRLRARRSLKPRIFNNRNRGLAVILKSA